MKNNMINDKAKVFSILLIEDDKIDQDIFKIALNKLELFFDLRVEENLNIFKFSKNIDEINSYDLIVMDYNFRGEVAADILHNFRKNLGLNLPVIVLTGVECEVLKNKIEQYKNVRFLTKSSEVYYNLAKIIKEILTSNKYEE